MAIPVQYSLRNLWTRRLTTAMTAVGMALVVFVFAAVLMLAHGLERTLVSTGKPDNVLVVRRSATSEVQSFLAREQTRTIATSQEIAAGSDGSPLAGAETLSIINLPKRGSGKPSNVSIRGASPQAAVLRPQVKLVEGRMWKPGSSEVIVARAVASRFQGAGPVPGRGARRDDPLRATGLDRGGDLRRRGQRVRFGDLGRCRSDDASLSANRLFLGPAPPP